jgi:hypothetical protein
MVIGLLEQPSISFQLWLRVNPRPKSVKKNNAAQRNVVNSFNIMIFKLFDSYAFLAKNFFLPNGNRYKNMTPKKRKDVFSG